MAEDACELRILYCIMFDSDLSTTLRDATGCCSILLSLSAAPSHGTALRLLLARSVREELGTRHRCLPAGLALFLPGIGLL